MTKKSKKKSSKALNEFVNEAQDILEALGRDLMALDRTPKDQEADPDLINNLFRGVHTLKSLSGMFGVEYLTDLAHQEESLLEEIRLGRIPLSPNILNLLFESLEVITMIIAKVNETGDVEEASLLGSTEEFIAKIAMAAGKHEVAASIIPNVNGDPLQRLGDDVLEVLTEYEEHRLKTNLKRGLPIYRISMRFDLDSIDLNLEEVRSKLKPIGEIITYLPSSDESDIDKLGIDIILVLTEQRVELESTLDGWEADVREVVPASRHTAEPKRPTVPPSFMPEEAEAEEETPDTEMPLVKPSIVSRAPAQAEEQALSLRSVSQTVRVDIRKLDNLMNVVGELAVVRTAISRMSERVSQIIGHSDLTIELDQMNRGLDRRLTALREGILEVRMVPLGQMFDRLARMVRKISMELNKEIHFVISGSDTEVDKLITEELSDPLMHLIRNAIDHGVEPASERNRQGKPKFGTVALTAYQKGSHVVIEVEDDGAGIDNQRLIAVAVERGYLDEESAAALTHREAVNLIFLPGISTSDETTEISGRGVGMDIVKTNVSALGGVIEVQSEPQIGTKFTITLPVTLATIQALLVGVDEKTYAIPLNTVTEAVFVPVKDIRPVLGNETIALRGETLVLCRLSEFFGIPRREVEEEELCVVVATLGQQRLGMVVDALYSQQDVVIKSLGPSLKDLACFSGATDIGEERLALVIDTSQIIDRFFSTQDGPELRAQMV
jgi:two-component system chemotaxis sensor kinase CheA